MNRARTLAGAALLALLLSACAIAPDPGSSPSATPDVTPVPTTALPQATASATAGPAWSVETLSNNDPALPVHLQWPVVPGAPELTRVLGADLAARERAFLAEYEPNAEAPPELRGTWQTVLDAPAWVGVRIELYEFAGASGQVTTTVVYGQNMAGQALRSSDLVAPAAQRAAVDAIAAALRADGHEVLDDLVGAPGVEEQLLQDLVFGPRGELVVRVGEGVALPFSDGIVDVTLQPSVAEGLLSEQGRHVRDAAVDLTGPVSPSPEPPVAVPQPAASVDCAVAQCVALTFDDGPGRETARLLDDLAREGVPATFFVLGTSAKAQPALVRRMAAEGHEVGTHTLSHKQLTKLSAEGQRAEIARGIEAVEAVGVTPTVFRPPYGSYNDATRSVVGAPMVLWDVDTLDWKTRSADATVSAAVGGAKAGSIVLMHDIHAPTVDALPRVVAGLREKGFTLVTVSTLLGTREPGSVSSRR